MLTKASSIGLMPVHQPPRNRITPTALTKYMLAYSARKKNDHRMPLYSVWKPPTSSLSASARSNGARLLLASVTVKKVKNAKNVNGSRNTNQLTNQPDCIWPIWFRSMVPAIITGMTAVIPSGTS